MGEASAGDALRYAASALWSTLVRLERSEEGTKVHHLVTRETISLPPAQSEGGYDICFDEGDLYITQGCSRKLGKVAARFQEEVQFEESTKTVYAVSETGRRELRADVFPVSARYMAVQYGRHTFKLKLYVTSWTNPSHWWEARLLGRPWDEDLAKFFDHLTTTHMQNWEVWTSKLIPPLCGYRYHCRAKRPSFLHCLPENAVSSVALLIICSHRVLHGRPLTSRGTT